MSEVDRDVLRAAIVEIEREYQSASEPLRALTEIKLRQRDDDEEDVADDDLVELEEGALKRRSERTRRLLGMALESAGLHRTRDEMLSDWEAANGGITWIDQSDSYDSDRLRVLDNYIAGIRMLATNGQSPTQQVDAYRLEQILLAIPTLIKRRKIIPNREHDIQKLMDDYLMTAFIGDYVQHPSITGMFKNFKPDGGIRTLRTAIEYKFISNDEELKRAVSGIIEDVGGYRGSLDWTRFYSVFYMTEAFDSPAPMHRELTRVGAHNWKPIFVHQSASAQQARGANNATTLGED